jgi:hypothetical protein
LLLLRRLERGALRSQRRVSVSATAPPALRAVCRNSRTGAFRWPPADGAADNFGEARNALLFVSRESFRTDLDTVDEGAVIVGKRFWETGERCHEFVQIAIVILGQCGSFSTDDNDNLHTKHIMFR